MRQRDAIGTVAEVDSLAGPVRLLYGRGTRYEATSETGAFSLKMVRGGSASWTAQGRTHTLHESLYLFLPAGTPYRVAIDSATRVETACLFFPDALLGYLGSPLLPDDGPENLPESRMQWRVRRSAGDARAMEPLVRLVTGQWTPSRDQLDQVLLDVVPALFVEQVRTPNGGALTALRPSTRQELVARVTIGRDYLLDHLSDAVDVRSAAAAAALSPFHFHRTFRAVFGVPPLRYVTERRLERAAFLLRHGSAPVTDVCLACGFESLSSFTRAFTRRFGAAPGRYRSGSDVPAAD